jgi:hypothetical protein
LKYEFRYRKKYLYYFFISKLYLAGISNGKQLMPHIWEEDGEAIKGIKRLVKD